MDIEVSRNDEKSRFEIFYQEELAGYCEFKMRGTTRMVLPHTEIDPKFGGKGIGTALVTYVLDDAIARNLTVAPYCHFVEKVIRENKERYLSLVPEAERVKFNLV